MKKVINENRPVAVKLQGVKKMYKLGQIGGGTLQADLQSWWAKRRGKADPNTKIDQKERLVGQTFMALNGIDLTVYQGEAVGIIGGNGAGKSTLLKLLSRVTAPTEGDIDIYGRIASMLEVGTGFNGEMTGRENVYMNGAILGMTKAEIDAKMNQIIEFSEVSDFIDTPVKRYSSGMYVKLAFSVAAHLDSEILIMDEVLAVGDMAFQKKCLTRMREAAKQEGRTVLYVSHNMNTIRKLCDRCIVLEKGKIIFEGNVEDAIEIYLGMGEMGDSRITYDSTFHSQITTPYFKIMYAECFTERKVKAGENIEFVLTGKAGERSLLDVQFRFEIQFQDGTIAGTMFTDLGIEFEADQQKKIEMSIDTAHFAPGRYFANIIAFLIDQYGNEIPLDGVYPGLIFEVIVDNENTLVWLHQWWGHICLHKIHIEGEE